MSPSDDELIDPTRPETASLEDVVADYICRREAGEAPQIDDYLARYPRYAEELARVLAYETAPPATGDEVRTKAEPDATGRLTGGWESRRNKAEAPARDDDAPRIGPYEILAHVSTAGGGTVYRARDRRTGVVVALKTLDGMGSLDLRDLERFRREGDVVRGLNLVNVVPILDAGEDRGRHWIAMKWIDGENLRELRARLVETTHRLHDVRERARLIARVARTFAEIHRFNITHRDVKPSNVMTDKTGEPMIIDFGIARAGGLTELTQTGDSRMGTPRYIAPEIVSHGNDAATASADIYGLGLCLYELTTDVEPFAGVGREALFSVIATTGPVPPRAVAPKLSFDLEAVILRAIEIDPARRYASMTAFADDLERVARGESPDKVTLARARPWVRFVVRRRKALAVAAFVVFVVLGGGFYAAVGFLIPEMEARALVREFAPFAWLPPDAVEDEIGVSEPKVYELAQRTAGREERKLLVAWVHFVHGRYPAALGMLELTESDDSFAVRLLRNQMRALVKEAEAQADTEASMPVTMEGELAPRLFRAEGRREMARDAAEFNAAYLEVFAAGPPTTAVDHIVAAALEWSVLPMAPDAPRGHAPQRIAANAREALADPATAPAAHYLLGALQLVEGRPAEARADLEAAAALRPQAVGARYLAGIAAFEAGDSASAVSLLESARAATPEARRAWPRLMGRLAEAYAAVGRHDDSAACLDAWLKSRVWTRWQDRTLPLALAGEIAERHGRTADAIKRYEEALEASPSWGPGYDRAAALSKKLGDADAAAAFVRLKAEQMTIPVPKDVETFLRLELRGLRPPDRKLVGGHMIQDVKAGEDK